MAKEQKENLKNESPAHVAADPRTSITSINPSEPEAPLVSLIDKEMSNMTDDELRAHVQALREAAGSNATLHAQMREAKTKTKRTPAKKRASKKSSKSAADTTTESDLISKYNF